MAEGDRTLISSSGLIKPRIGTGSLSRRMIIIAAAWISLLLLAGGIALDRVLTNAVSDNFDDQMEYVLTAMIASSEIGPDGEIRLNRPLGDQRFLEPNSGLYYQISGQGKEPWPSRSLWDRTLKVDYGHDDTEPHFRNSDEFQGEPLRILERVIVLPDSDTRWIFMVAASRESLDAQIT
ncbi:MAG: sensor histidine kinase N-terminal domain-containing protein, partial [Sphingomonadales bacterium]